MFQPAQFTSAGRQRRPIWPPFLACACAALLADAAQALPPQDCSMEQVSVASDGTPGNGASSRGTISIDGRYVAFESSASNLIADDTNAATDIFVHDRASASTQRVSVGALGVEANQASRRASISGTGRFVVFESDATNLVPGDTNQVTDIFVRDRQTNQTTRVSVGPLGANPNNRSAQPSISADGRYVAFQSYASNLVANDANGQLGDIFVRDRLLNVTELVSVSSSEIQANFTSQSASITYDGHFVVFESFATNLVPGIPAPLNIKYIFRRDRVAGTTQLVSRGTESSLPNGSSETPTASANGRFVAFRSRASNLGPDDMNAVWDVYLFDLVDSTAEIISPGGAHVAGDGDSYAPTISPDAQFLVFASVSPAVVSADTDTFADVFLRNFTVGGMTEISVAADGSPADDSSGLSLGSTITPGGRQVVFHSSATNIVAGDENAVSDVFVRECVDSVFTAFCSGTESACPCSNAATALGGCNNSFATGGAILSASGTPLMSADTITLTATGLPPISQALFFQGDERVADGLGEIHGDGLRCAGGVIFRLGLRTGAFGSVSLGNLIPGDVPVSVRGGLPFEGATRYYQALYRDNVNFCTPSNMNLSNAITIVYTP